VSSSFVRVVLVLVGFVRPVVFAPLPAIAGQQAPASPARAADSIAGESAAACAVLPANIQTDRYLAPALAQLLAKSPTFRRQCATVAAARHVRVTFTAVAARGLSTGPRARATITRFAHGLLRAAVEIPMPSEYHELIPHELEHVIEQIEGQNLTALAETDGRRVSAVGPWLFETERAQAAGRAAAAEMLADGDPAVARATRVLRALSSRAIRTRGTRGGNR
jgi:hypothetical protein